MAKEKNQIEQEQNTEGQKSEEVQAEAISEETEKQEQKKSTSKKKASKKDKKEELIIGLKKQVEDLSDKHLRLQAEFDNFRRRTLKEKADLIKSGGESVLVNILPVVDDIDRALDVMKEVNDDDPSKQGMVLIRNKFSEFLKQNNVKEIEALNQEFDCELHEALTKIPAPADDLKGKNVDVIQKGYMLNEKVIRFTKVVVGE